MKKIVVGVDGSRGSRVALRWAVEEARYRQVPLDVVMAWQDPLLTTIPVYGIEAPATDLQEQAETELLAVLREEGILELDDVDVATRIARAPAAPALLAAAAPDDILVVGSRGHGELAGMLLGSVSQRCATHAPCPVVVVPVDRPTDRLE